MKVKINHASINVSVKEIKALLRTKVVQPTMFEVMTTDCLWAWAVPQENIAKKIKSLKKRGYRLREIQVTKL